MAGAKSWRDALEGKIAPALGREIDVFAMEIELRKQGKIEERLFAETRLRRGVYGQRYDNGQRHDGEKTQEIPFPSGSLTKGPTTMWDAPGMLRIKIPFGGLSAAQLDVLAEVAEEYSDSILHVTTRQDFQLHFVHIDDTPDIMRRLAAVDITTREACGNSVRNVTACPYAGVCAEESFDVTPYASALAYFLLGHPDCQDFGRKFKIAFSGCKDNPCGLVMMHDMGAIARVRDGRRGFELFVGGGLGAVTHQAKLFDEFLPEEELLPLSQAICRVFARLGEKKNRQRARVKFLVAKMGIEAFKGAVLEERTKLSSDERWTSFLSDLHAKDDKPLKGPAALASGGPLPDGYEAWAKTNVMPQRQDGYSVATIRLPLGDLTSDQTRAVASLARAFVGDNLRLTVEQNIVFRWVPNAELPRLYEGLRAVGLALAGAGTIADVTACPGTDTCKLGISSSRGLAAELARQLGDLPNDKAVRRLRIKTSGCFNSCAQHHIADLGFLGVSRNVEGRRVPHFQVVLGGEFSRNAAAYGLALGAVPSKQIPNVVRRLTQAYLDKRNDGETFQEFIKRSGKGAIKELLADLIPVPAYEKDRSFYSDWGDPREYSISDYGEGECAGELVTAAQFGLAAAERETFEAQLKLDSGNPPEAAKLALGAMLQAAKSLLKAKNLEPDGPESIVSAFKEHLHETKLFSDPFAGDKFAQYFFHLSQQPLEAASADDANRWIQEAALFVDAAHSCYERLVALPKTTA